MKLATFEAGGAPELGVVQADRIIPLSRAAPNLVADMIDLIARWTEVEGEVRAIAGRAADSLPMDRVRLLAPVRRPGKIMAIGLNYADHTAESGFEPPAHQVWFSKAATAASGPFDPIRIPRGSAFVDYEAEMVVVIGAGGRHIARADAPKAVFGFCVGDDATERAWQHRTSQWVLGKSFDSHAPFGPWITTADEVPDPHRLAIRGLVNGELRQQSDTGRLVFDVWDQIEHLSQAMTLEPGDLIFTGTPAGVGAAMKPPQFLKPGDRVRVEIDGLGAIENPCVAEA
ncbi:fumarylacetoacetate hydrolase family protein [Phenylobacterium sp.]|jgi:2-keto-4-pentenoate hydratase/2-oxohepta-3-ene-1,7-dioic acid hydratase in catechol pathway|uniref:fumarylacetoacetate hydrolase family protein n=1 Tax=Phenylobacterium sp. TaxID=1871053 RepID=UPI002E2F714C|nr:fumarylacetoacetate hydrolase family protein [Phenylobacterium sp.]HEX4711666.1 fumarylacetoacetate hydrolase family protein [Phenylobacterium sp.]